MTAPEPDAPVPFHVAYARRCQRCGFKLLQGRTAYRVDDRTLCGRCAGIPQTRRRSR
jgi:formylmethanofuran dehydrogenase subunit E